MEVYYIEAGIFEEMLARADSLSAQVDRLYEKNREKKLSGIPDGWHSPKSNGKSTTGRRTWKS